MSTRARLVGLLVVLACMAPSLVTPTGARAQSVLAFGPCSRVQVVVPANGLQCATLDVSFDRADPSVPDVGLAVQRVPASAPAQGSDRAACGWSRPACSAAV